MALIKCLTKLIKYRTYQIYRQRRDKEWADIKKHPENDLEC